MDTSGRMRRLVLALIIGSAAAAVAYFVANSLATPDSAKGSYQTGGAYRFVFYMTAFAGALTFAIALLIQNKLADMRYRQGLVAKAQLHKS